MTLENNEEITADFDDMLDEMHDTYEVAGVKFTASQVLKECDPIAYKECFLGYLTMRGETE